MARSHPAPCTFGFVSPTFLGGAGNQEALQGDRVKEKLPIFRERVNPPPEEGPGITKSPLVFPVTVQHGPATGADHGCDAIMWRPIEKIDLMHFKEAIIPYKVHSPYVKQILIIGLPKIVIPQDWKGFITAVPEASQRLQWLTWWREEDIRTHQHTEQGE